MLLICIMVLLFSILLLYPGKIGGNKDPYKIIRGANEAEQKHLIEKYDEAFWGRSIKLANRISKVIPIHIKPLRKEKLESKIIFAGMQKVLSVEDVQSIKIAFSLITFIYFITMSIIAQDLLIMLLGLASVNIAYYSPEYLITVRAKNRQLKISHEVPNVLTSLAVVTDAGLNLIPAIEMIVKEGKGELIKEMKKALEDIYIGISQKDAFLRLSRRCDVEEVNYFIVALVQGLEKGNSGLTKIIRQQAEESWHKRRFKAKELAEKASMKLFMPLLLMVFPAFGIFLVGPMIFSLIKLFSVMK